MKKVIKRIFNTKFTQIYLAISIGILIYSVETYNNVCFADVNSSLTSFQVLIFTLIRIVGIIVTGFAAVQVGMSFKNHDAAQRAMAIPGVLGGLIIIFTKEILASIGAM